MQHACHRLSKRGNPQVAMELVQQQDNCSTPSVTPTVIRPARIPLLRPAQVKKTLEANILRIWRQGLEEEANDALRGSRQAGF